MNMQLQWQGTDGSIWDLLQGPVRTSMAGIKGLGMPDSVDQVKQFALLDGQQFLGYKLGPRDVWLPLKFKGAGEVDVEGVQRQWWQSLGFGQYGTLTCTDASGGTRQLRLRFQSDGGMVYAIQPYIRTDAFGIDFVADQPWWLGPPTSFAFGVGAGGGQGFFGNGAGATPFYIQPAGGTGSQVVTNEGDAPAYPTITVAGPLSSWDVSIGGRHVGGGALVDGDVLTVYTDPQAQYASLSPAGGGAPSIVTGQLAAIDFAALDPGAAMPLVLSANGTGQISVSFQPKYARAF